MDVSHPGNGSRRDMVMSRLGDLTEEKQNMFFFDGCVYVIPFPTNLGNLPPEKGENPAHLRTVSLGLPVPFTHTPLEHQLSQAEQTKETCFFCMYSQCWTLSAGGEEGGKTYSKVVRPWYKARQAGARSWQSGTAATFSSLIQPREGNQPH